MRVVRRAAALLLVLAVGCEPGSGCGAAGWKSPEEQVRDALAREERGFRGELTGGFVVELSALRYVEPAISVEQRRATVAAMVDAEGRVTRARQDGPAIALRYLGRERFHLSRCAAGWCAERDELERLRGVLVALLGRERAAGEGRATAWQVRVERDRAEVGEDRVGDAGGVAAPQRALHQLAWERDRWVFVDGR